MYGLSVSLKVGGFKEIFMTDSEFNLGRKKYLNLLKRRKKYFDKKQRYYDLLKEPLIKEYIEIALFLSEHNDEEFDLNILRKKAFDKLAKKTACSYGIYIYVGKTNNLIRLVNIETLKKIEVSLKSYENLKEHGCIVFIKKENGTDDFYESKVLEIRNEYLSNLTELDPESAKQKILKYGQNNEKRRF